MVSNHDSRTQLGADRLTKHFGGNTWADKVNVFKLDMADYEKCILGQVFGSYELGIEKLWPSSYTSPDTCMNHGFVGRSIQDEADLKRAWTKLILAAREKPRAGDKVRITFETTMPSNTGYQMVAVNPYAADNQVEIIKRAVIPNPGDRVSKGVLTGTVVAAKSAKPESAVWVLWDGSTSKGAQEEYGPALKVQPQRYREPFAIPETFVRLTF